MDGNSIFTTQNLPDQIRLDSCIFLVKVFFIRIFKVRVQRKVTKKDDRRMNGIFRDL